MQNNATLSAEAMRVITALQHKNGTYDYYRATIDRIYTYILHAGDEIGMSDTEILHTVRALDGIRSDLKDLAGASISEAEGADTAEHVAAPVDVITMEHVDFSDTPEEASENVDPDTIRQREYAEKTAGLFKNAAAEVSSGYDMLSKAMFYSRLCGVSGYFRGKVEEIERHLFDSLLQIRLLSTNSAFCNIPGNEQEDEEGGQP